ncbi:hypothetical protein X777_12530 [Ooceraea biroi]|uniref:Uncharacterized protein n=1 Tax=Ooceraea biroi TaxID=2015173 RepID=A0A026VZG3_OOCBI|nr:hypothetical protein X777_12530 [Ooceraea biroi]
MQLRETTGATAALLAPRRRLRDLRFPQTLALFVSSLLTHGITRARQIESQSERGRRDGETARSGECEWKKREHGGESEKRRSPLPRPSATTASPLPTATSTSSSSTSFSISCTTTIPCPFPTSRGPASKEASFALSTYPRIMINGVLLFLALATPFYTSQNKQRRSRVAK